MKNPRTTEMIQESYAKNIGYNSFTELLLADVSEIDWHVSNVQKEYAKDITDQELLNVKIMSITQMSDGAVFNIGDHVKFSNRFDGFILSRIIHNVVERRMELHGDGLFCTLNESNCYVVNNNTL